MHRLVYVALAATLVACGAREAWTGSAGIVARTPHMELERDTLADIMVSGKNVPLERDMVERWAFQWVSFALLAERLAEGDSLLDSATVMEAMWPDASQWLVSDLHERLAKERVKIDSATIDSAYAAGNDRLIDHILIRTTPDMSPPARTAAERKARAIRDQLAAGESWEKANEQNEDPVAKRAGGRLGVIERGQYPPAFDDVAFALAPGEISQPVATQYGLHIIRRPALDSVRDAYTEAVTDLLTGRMRDDYLEELDRERKVQINSGAAALMREAAQTPLRTYQSPRVIGTFRGGKFTTADFVHWLQALRGDVARSVPGATDAQLDELARSLIRNEALIAEAKDEGMSLAEGDLQDLRDRLREEIDHVQTVIGLDSAMAGLTSTDARLAAADTAILGYFRRVADRNAPAVVVPPFLAEMLRSSMKWDVSQAGIDQTLELAMRLRDEQRMPPGAVPMTPVPDSVGGDGAR